MDRFAQFAGLVSKLGLQASKRDLLVNWFVNYQREQLAEIPQNVNEDQLETYLDQIVNMFKEHKNLSDDVYKNYIKFVFERCYLSKKSIKK